MSEYTPQGSVPAGPPNSTTAIISLIAGILGLTVLPFIGSIVAVITGPMAKREIAESGGGLSGEGLATAGTVLGWIGIGLAVLGCCIATAVIAIPLCGLWAGFSSDVFNLIVPTLLGLF